MKDFIITSLQTWDIEIGSTIKNTALEISKQNRVLYINTPMDYSTRLKATSKLPPYIRRMSVIKGEASPLQQINKNMWVLDCPFTLLSVNFLPAPCSTSSTDRTTAVSAGGLCSKLHNSVLRTTSILLIRTSTAAGI